jgi:hypothetical protein
VSELEEFAAVDAEGARPPPQALDYKLIREGTARWLGLGVGVLFAATVLAVACGHLLGVNVAMQAPPRGLEGTDLEAWFR